MAGAWAFSTDWVEEGGGSAFSRPSGFVEVSELKKKRKKNKKKNLSDSL